MTLLLAGCLLFLASHLISAVGLRARVTALGGQPAYMGLVTAGSVVAIVMMVQGYQSAGFTGLWSPAAAAYPLAVYVMPFAAVLIAAGNIPCNIPRFVKHPMLTGIALWSLLHLLANGDLASTLVFVTFGGYAVYRRQTLTPKAAEKQPVYRDVVAVAVGLALFALLFRFHEALSGVGLV